MRMLLDCSQTYRSDLHTGIQRVVRNLINCSQAQGQWAEAPCIAVQFGREGFRRVEEQLEYASSIPVAPQIPHALTSMYARLRALLGKLVPLPLVRQFLFAPGADFGLTNILKTGLTVLRSPRFLLQWGRPAVQGQAVALQPGDIVVVLEPFFSTQFWHTVAKTPDVRVVTLMHDIFPLTHPQFFSAVLVEHFREWFQHAIHQSAALITTSQATQDAIQEYLTERPRLTDGRRLPIGHFRPGADLDGQRGAGAVRQSVQALLSQGPDAYLCVGTLEARKNVGFVLDAFDRLWAQGVAVRLIFVGRPGWNAGAVLTRIRHHPRLGQSLLLLEDLNDAELDLAYRHARALVMASQAE
ncbi:MAG TPA: glycosyltransferase, partial [bacterium]|nr:glycosyltransferase [bacterium]